MTIARIELKVKVMGQVNAVGPTSRFRMSSKHIQKQLVGYFTGTLSRTLDFEHFTRHDDRRNVL